MDNISSNDFEEEMICSLAVKGEKSIHKLLLNVLSIVKHLKTLQSDPVLVYQMSTKEQQDFQTSQLQNLQQSNSNNTTTSSSSSSSTTTTNTNNTTNTSKSQDNSSSPNSATSNNSSNSNIQVLNLNASTFLNDNDKIKELNQNCLTSVISIQNIIKEIVQLENKINEREINNSSSSTTNNSQTFLVEELESLKYEAYQKNCTIKKLIDNMRLLQLSINSMNRTNLSD